jgi:hypothetical protein
MADLKAFSAGLLPHESPCGTKYRRHPAHEGFAFEAVWRDFFSHGVFVSVSKKVFLNAIYPVHLWEKRSGYSSAASEFCFAAIKF